MAKITGPVTGGVDTHADAHVAAAVDQAGRLLGTESFSTGEAGYAALLSWLAGHGPLERVAVEGTGSYGAGLARYLAAQGVTVLEAPRPDRQRRRRHGKSDVVDAISAAMAALAGEDCGLPKGGDGPAESIRALRAAREGAVKARTQAANQLRDLTVTAPGPVRAQLAGLKTPRRVRAAAAFTCGDLADPAEGTKAAMASVAARWLALDAEVTRLEAGLEDLIAAIAAPQFPASPGAGPLTVAALIAAAGDNPARIGSEAAFAALCGASTVDCSSGKQQRHRLNRGGDRQANSALWRIAVTRIRCDPATQAYYERRTAEGKTRKEIIRELKRYIARQAYRQLIRPGFTTPAAPPRQAA
ncbi:MAG TPA: IS110 family transposase [Streptosporangiaceae bacterium]|nr:IS110 family transposase [Streptosporangiaceae bacterium]